MTHASAIGPFSLPNPFHAALPRALAAAALPVVEATFGLRRMNRVYEQAVQGLPHRRFCDGALDSLGVRFCVSDEDLARIPAGGPLIVAANHPFGAIDGLVLHSLLLRVRSDVKLFGSTLLSRLEAYRDDFFFVDNFGGPDAAGRNVSAMKAALRHLRDRKGCVGVFPAGEVAHATLRAPRTITDPPWSESVARLAQRGGAAILPVFFDGHNSALFQIAGMIHPRLRTALLARETVNRRNSVVRVYVGGVISPRRIARFPSPRQLIDHVRLRTCVLAGRAGHRGGRRQKAVAPAAVQQPLAAPVPVERLSAEIDALPPRTELARLGDYAVVLVSAGQAPAVLEEIGRLREMTFRLVGEGTGRATDIDRFDTDYLHLFVWDRGRREIVGAYRMGLCDRILAERGIGGLYTSTLFRYDRTLLERIGPAIELGRSFVRPEHQKEFAPLMLLWRGIGLFVADNPRYRMLLGPVSISNAYQSMSKRILMAFLEHNGAGRELQRLVTPRNPPPRSTGLRDIEHTLAASTVASVEDVDDLVAEIESDRLSMPILLRQYLKLNAKLLAFNVDPDFGDVLDGLMLADLTRVDRLMLARYMGREASERFLRAHGLLDDALQPTPDSEAAAVSPIADRRE